MLKIVVQKVARRIRIEIKARYSGIEKAQTIVKAHKGVAVEQIQSAQKSENSDKRPPSLPKTFVNVFAFLHDFSQNRKFPQI